MKLSEATERLRIAGIADSKYEARLLFSHFGKIPQSELVANDAICSSPELDNAIERRVKREPIQYIIGECGFYREIYEVTPAVLIPRQDTEILVDYAVKNLPRGAKFLDLCTGSGCIAISTLKNTAGTTAKAVDISKEALEVAERNAARCDALNRIEFIEADALNQKINGDFFAVLSNPPYVTRAAYAHLDPEIYHEPEAAFLGGDDGLLFYRRITSLYKDTIPSDGFIAFEIGYDQGDALTALAKREGMNCEIIKDYSQNDRVAILTKQ